MLRHGLENTARRFADAEMAVFARDRWGGYITTGLVAFTSGITLYLIISDTARRSEVRRRKNILATLDDETCLSPLQKARQRYSVLRIGGRFVNPFDEYFGCSEEVLIVGGGSREPGSGRCGKC